MHTADFQLEKTNEKTRTEMLSQEEIQVASDTLDDARPKRPAREDFEVNEFNYRPVSVVAVVGLVLSLISSAAIFIWLVLPLCLLATFISTVGLISIRRSRGGYSGTPVALLGIFLGTSFFLGGVGFQVYAYQTEVPDGYQRLSFAADISEKEVIQEDGETKPHPDVAALEGKPVFIKGYIYQTGQLTDIGSFLLVKDNADCCFGGKPKIWDRLGVVMQDGKKIDYRAGKVAVAGTFRLNPNFKGESELEPIYIVEADYFSTHVSDF
ncbi:hypothetical protein [Planctomicrobium sp. SH527]|uniref:hypothetical protein n=1 Tax=Planctomicrobium sp. SH527 TaxID=3448123 RepID=UPI003F5B4890